MTSAELAKIPANKIRNDKQLMQLYIERYKAVFGYKPNCASCTFSHDYSKFTAAVLHSNHKPILKSNKMAQKFKLKRKHLGDILTYREGGKVHRLYGRLVTDEFAEGFLKNGSDEQIAEREKMFEATPKSASGKADSKKAQDTAKAAKKEANEANIENQPKSETEQIAELPLDEYDEKVKSIDSADKLEELRSIEKENGDRKGAYEILDSRMNEIKESGDKDPLPRKQRGRKSEK